MKNVIVVTGATGHVGRELALRLLAAGQSVRAVARSAEKLRPLGARGAELRPGSLDDRAFVADVCRGAAGVFGMIPPNFSSAEPRAEQRKVAENLAAAIRDSGVKHVVALSSVGADLPDRNGPIAGLHDFEAALDAVPGLDRVHLRAAYFMENHLGSIASIRKGGINAGAWKPDRAFPMVATRDIAAAAAGYLESLGFEGRNVRYVLGPRDYHMREATRILGAAIGRPDLAYVEVPEADSRKAFVGAGFSPSMADLYVEMVRAFNAGLIKAEPRSQANTTPTTLEEFAKTVFAPAFESTASHAA
jgi:uncharacterized protein YbjT (DUF2867 family)